MDFLLMGGWGVADWMIATALLVVAFVVAVNCISTRKLRKNI